MRILITGGAGFIGSTLGRELRRQQHYVVGLDDLSRGYLENLEDGGFQSFDEFHVGDVRQAEDLRCCEGIDAVVHLAAVSNLANCESDPRTCWDVNVGGTVEVVQACRRYGVGRLVFASTSAVYENCPVPIRSVDLPQHPPTLQYSQSKWACEGLLNGFSDNYGIPVSILRLFNVYGPHQDIKRKNPALVGYMIGSLIGGRSPVLFADADYPRDYVYVDDVVCALVDALTPPVRSGTFDVCSGESAGVETIYRYVRDVLIECMSVVEEPTWENPERYWSTYPTLADPPYPLKSTRIVQEVSKQVVMASAVNSLQLTWKPATTLQAGLRKCCRVALRASK